MCAPERLDPPIQIEGPVWLVPGQGGGRFPFANAVLIRDGETALVDTGCGPLALAQLGRGAGIELIINTHCHPDHCAGNHRFPHAEVLVPEPGLEGAGDLRRLSERFFPHEPELQPVWRRFVRQAMSFGERPVDGCFRPGQVLQVGRTRVEVVPAPGHTVDHCCLWLPQHGILVSADMDLTRFGPWYGHPESSLEQLRLSLARLRALKSRVVLSAHRPPVFEQVDRAFADYGAILELRAARILRLLRRSSSLAQLVDAASIYGRFPMVPELLRSWEAEMLRKHLDELEAQGRVEQLDGRYLARDVRRTPL